MKRFYSQQKIDSRKTIDITGSEAIHMHNVLRLAKGEMVELFDGTGLNYNGIIVSISAQCVTIDIRGRSMADKESKLEISLAQGYLKGKKMDTLIRQLTELGVHKWIPFYAHRSVPVEKQRNEKNDPVNRWQKIAMESMKQCHRSMMPKIHKPVKFKDLFDISGKQDLSIIFWEKETVLLNKHLSGQEQTISKIMIILGPEGGFTDEEIALAKQHNIVTAGLGPRILRAETATLAACALIQYCLGDMGALQ